MAKYESFHLRYDGGQRAIWGGIAGLAEYFETFASGLPTDAVWRTGGPLLAPGADKEQHVLAWVRGIPLQEVGREGAWQAWGVAGPAGGFANWMSFWDALTAAPERERLDELAAAFSRGGRGAMYPPVPLRLASVLADLHTTESSTRRIALTAPSELPIIAWSCLLGPVSPAEATFGVPRRMRLNLKVPVVYDVSVADGSLLEPRSAEAASALLIDIVAAVQRGDTESALATVKSLRETPMNARQKRIFAPRAFAETPFLPKAEDDRKSWKNEMIVRGTPAPDDVAEEPETPSRPQIRWSRVFNRTFFGFSTLLIILLLVVHMSRTDHGNQAEVTQTDSAGTTTHGATGVTDTTATTATTTTTIATEPAVNCDTWWTEPQSRSIVLQRVNRIITARGWAVTGPASALFSDATWDSRAANTAALLAVQLQINVTVCASTSLDGAPGPRTSRAFTVCTNQGRTIIQDEDALKWLCTWSIPQS